MDLLNFGTDRDKANEHYQKALELANAKEYKETVEELKKALQLDEEFALAWAQLTYYLALANKFQELKPALSKTIALNSQDPEVWSTLGKAFLEVPGAHEEAFNCFQASLACGETTAGWKGLGDSLLKLGELDAVCAVYEQWCQFDPENPDAWFKLGQSLNMLKEHEQAISAFQNVLGLNPKHFRANKELHRILSLLNKHEKAISICIEWLSNQPEELKAWQILASSFAKIYRYESAIKCYEKALQIDDKQDETWQHLLNTVYSNEQYEDTIDYVAQAPKNIKSWVTTELHAKSLMMLGDYEKAIHYFEKLVRKSSKTELSEAILFGEISYFPAANIAICLSNTGRFDEALQMVNLLEVYSIQGIERQVAHLIAESHRIVCMGNYKEGLELIARRTVDCGKAVDYYESWKFMLENYNRSGVVSLPFQAFDIYLAQTYQPRSTEIAKIISQRRIGAFQSALAIIKKITEDATCTNAEVYLESAIIYALQKDYDKAIEALQKTIDLNANLSERISLIPYFNSLKNNERFQALVNPEWNPYKSFFER